MNKNDCEAAESIADSFLRMARVNCNFLRERDWYGGGKSLQFAVIFIIMLE